MTLAYTAGTITLTNGSKAVTGIGTGWQTALIAGGVIYPDASGNALPIETVDSNTGITADVAWQGATGTYSYALVRDTAYLQQLSANAQALATYISRLDSASLGALAAIAGTLGAGKVPRGLSGNTMEWMTVSDAAKTVLDDPTTTAMLATLGGAKKSGETFTGLIGVDTPAAGYATMQFRSDGTLRWDLGREGGTGHFFLNSFDAGGVYQRTPFWIDANGGQIKMANQPMCRADIGLGLGTLTQDVNHGLLPSNGFVNYNRGGFYPGGNVGGYCALHVPHTGVYLVTLKFFCIASSPSRRLALTVNGTWDAFFALAGAGDTIVQATCILPLQGGDWLGMTPRFGDVTGYFSPAHTEVSVAFMG